MSCPIFETGFMSTIMCSVQKEPAKIQVFPIIIVIIIIIIVTIITIVVVGALPIHVCGPA